MEIDTAAINTASTKPHEEWISFAGRLLAGLLVFGPVVLAAMR